MSDCTTSWFGGLTCDHIYADCPSRQRVTGEVELRWIAHRGDHLDPHGTDVCGLCLHRHNRTTHRESATTPTPPTTEGAGA